MDHNGRARTKQLILLRLWTFVGVRQSPRYASLKGVTIFLFRVADAVRRNRTVTACNHQNVIIAIVDNPLYERPLVLASCRKQLHSRRHTVQLQQGLHQFLPLFDKVLVG